MRSETRAADRARWPGWVRTILASVVVLSTYLLVALWATRPLVWHFRDHSPFGFRVTNFDVPLNAWILSWGTHALFTQPFRFFAANIYHPAPNSLAYTEHMLGILPFFAPGYLATGNPVVALNVQVLCGLVLSAAGMFLLVWRWTRSWPAALLAGLVFGFYPNQVHAIGPNLQTIQYFPVILLFLEKLLARPGWLAACGLTLALLGQCAVSYYYAYPAFLGTAAIGVVASLSGKSRPTLRSIGQLSIALVAVAALMMLLSVPYSRIADGGFQTIYEPKLQTMPQPISRIVSLVLEQVGAVPLLLGGLAVALALRRDAEALVRWRVILLLTCFSVGILLVAGTTLSVFGHLIPMPARVLNEYAPGFRVLRDRARFFVLVPLAVGALAGLGVAQLSRLRLRSRFLGVLLAAAGIIGFGFPWRLGPSDIMKLPAPEDVPAIYRELGSLDAGPLLVLPVGVDERDLRVVRKQTEYAYYSIFHWRPLLNGYASYWPPGFETLMSLARALPEPRALEILVACTQLEWIILHGRELSPESLERWSGPLPGLQLVTDDGGDRLYRVVERPRFQCAIDPFERNPSRTLYGTPRQILPREERRAAVIDLDLPRSIAVDVYARPKQGRVTIQNTGRTTWPAVGSGEAGLVQLSYRWLDDRRERLPDEPRVLRGRLPVDLAPGEMIEMPFPYYAPQRPGIYHLELLLHQPGQPPFALSGPNGEPVRIRIVPPAEP